MPLKRGSSPKTVSANIGEMVRSYKKKGKIGSSKPKSVGAAAKQAAAIAYEKAGNAQGMKKGGSVQGPAMIVRKKDGDRPVKIY